jgi:hypothetical protein
LEIRVLFKSGITPISRLYDPDRRALVDRFASDFVIAGKLSQNLEDGKLHLLRFRSRKLIPAEIHYDLYNTEIIAVVFSLKKNGNYLHGAKYWTKILLDYQNLTCFKYAILLNRRQGRWAEELKQYNFQLFYRKGSSNAKADILSRCQAFTSRE